MLARRFGISLLGLTLASVVAASCGGSVSKRPPSNGDAGEAGSSEPAGGTGGSGGSSGASGAVGTGGAAAGSSAAGEGGSSGASDAGSGGTSDAGEGGMGGAAGAPDEEPPLDVGPGCLPPANLTKLSPAAAGLPTDGLMLWLRGDRGVYATAEQRVCAWADQSGNKRLFSASSGARPLFVASGLAQRPAIDFDVANSLLSTSGVLGIPATSGRTFIVVVQSVDTTGRFAAIQQGQSGTPGTYVGIDANTFNTTGNDATGHLEGVYVSNNSYDSTFRTGTTPHLHVFTITTMVPGLPVLANVDYRVNGSAQSLTRCSGGLGNGNIEDFSGANFSLVGNGARSLIAEAIVYDRALIPSERIAVETALEARYGIQ